MPPPSSARSPAAICLAVALVVLLVGLVVWATCRVQAYRSRFTVEQTLPVEAQVDGRAYRVHPTHRDPAAAANALAALNVRVIDLMRVLRARYIRDPRGAAFPARVAAVRRLLARYNPDNLAENSPRDPTGDTAFTTGKGALVAICLRDRDENGEALVDLDTLTFVTFHEMAHIAVDAMDHPPEFWSTFKFLLEESAGAGIFTAPNYDREKRRYCGVLIDYSVLYDKSLPSIY